MSTATPNYTAPDRPTHSAAWVAQTQITFAVSIIAMAWGIVSLPLDTWARGYLGMGTLLIVVSSISLAKTMRDQHEAQSVSRKVEGARIERFLAEQDPLAS